MNNLSKGQELIKKLLDIINKILQLRINIKRAIKTAQIKLEKAFKKKKGLFSKRKFSTLF